MLQIQLISPDLQWIGIHAIKEQECESILLYQGRLQVCRGFWDSNPLPLKWSQIHKPATALACPSDVFSNPFMSPIAFPRDKLSCSIHLNHNMAEKYLTPRSWGGNDRTALCEYEYKTVKVSDQYNLNLQLTKGFSACRIHSCLRIALQNASLSAVWATDSRKSEHKRLPLHSLTHDRRFRQAGFSEASGRVSRQHSGPAPAAHWTAPPQTLRTHSHGFTTLSVGNSGWIRQRNLNKWSHETWPHSFTHLPKVTPSLSSHAQNIT